MTVGQIILQLWLWILINILVSIIIWLGVMATKDNTQYVFYILVLASQAINTVCWTALVHDCWEKKM